MSLPNCLTYRINVQGWLQCQPVTTTAYCKLYRKITNIKKMGVSALDLHAKSKKHKNTIATLVSASPINTHFAGMIKSQFLYIWGEFFVFRHFEWQNSLHGHSSEMSTHGKNLNVLINTAHYFSQIFIAAVNPTSQLHQDFLFVSRHKY